MSSRRLRERVAQTAQAAGLLADPQAIVALAVDAFAEACPRGVTLGYTRGAQDRFGAVAARYDGVAIPRTALGAKPSHPWIVDIERVPIWQRDCWVEPMHEGVHGPDYFSPSHPIRRIWGARCRPDYGRMMVCHEGRLVAWVGVLVDACCDFTTVEQAALRNLAAQLSMPLRIAAALQGDARRIPLAPRQTEVMSRVARGWTNKRIARDLDIAPATVKTVLERLFKVSGCANRAALVLWWRGG